jgi:hypothetical protein
MAKTMTAPIRMNRVLELVDIADSEALFEAYGLTIPVLRRVDTGAELGWPFDTEQVVAFLF